MLNIDHPVYWKNGSDLCKKSIFIFSNDPIHAFVFVFEVTKLVCKNVNELSNKEINKIFYFSDGCASQYKNYQKFFNLTNHRKNLGIEADWSFLLPHMEKIVMMTLVVV